MHRGEIGQIALHNFGSEYSQGLSPLILPPHPGADLMPLGKQHFGEVAADSTDVAGRSGNEYRAALCWFHCHFHLPCSCIQKCRSSPAPCLRLVFQQTFNDVGDLFAGLAVRGNATPGEVDVLE